MLNFNSLYLELVGYVSILCSFIPCWVICVLLWQVYSFKGPSRLKNESNLLEFAWTLGPTVSVGALCYFNLGCIANDTVDSISKVVKVVGRQWYWSYEIPGEESLYDSVMLDFINSVDKPLRLSLNAPHQLVVTSSDVIHSFSLPDFHIKMDAIPGRINQIFFCPERLGVFIGYCSELCGAGHAYMPIVVEVVKG